MNSAVRVDSKQALRMYRSMLLIRRFEQRFLDLRDQRKARGGVAVSIGQEAVAVGVCSALTDDDYVTSTHRGHGHCLAKGADPSRLMAEFLGRRDGYCGGKGGPMHVAAPEIGLMGTNGIVGAGIAIANGLALAARRAGSERVAVSFFGDGAANTGAFHEALNLAAAWTLPVVFVCENNLYAIATKIETTTGPGELYKRGEALGIPSCAVDGNDVLSVYGQARSAVELARSGGGPTFLECRTYRWEGWAWKDRGRGLSHYRTEEEWSTWQARDPIQRLRKHLLLQDLLPPQREAELEAEIEAEVEEAVRFALASPEPDPSALESDVFSPAREQR